MSFSSDIKKQIDDFAREQSQHYLDDAEMTYMEKLHLKTDTAKRKAVAKIARLKSRSDQAVEAQNDLMLYMSDYMEDLISKGMSEREAFETAKEELTLSSESDSSAELRDRYRRYYDGFDIYRNEEVGLFYAGFSSLGLFLGALLGFLLSGGRQEFIGGGWIDTIIGAGAGMLLGSACAQISHAFTLKKTRR